MVDPIPSFHDGYLTGIFVGEENARLVLRKENGESAELNMSGVQALHAEDVRQGNIIYSVEVVRGVPPAEWVLSRLFPSPHPLAAPEYHDAYAKVIADKTSQVVSGNAIVVVVTPSYGADLVAFCESVTITWHNRD